jgi:epimerase transport system membrane fusion protein
LRTNRQLDQGQQSIMQERISQIGEQINSRVERRKTLMQQLVLVRSELEDLQSLFDRQLVTKARLIDRQKDENELLGDLRVIESDIAGDRAQMAEIKQRMTQVQRDRQQQIAGDMQIVKEQVFELRERIAAASDVGTRLSLRAPISGKVIDLSLNTVGAVIAPGATLMRIVPQDLPMVIVARVAPADVDEISIGGEARVRLLAYSYRKTPLVMGTVVDISGDSMFDQAAGVSYYEILVRVDDESLAQIPDVKALPGMPAQVLVTTREQSIMAYILDPVLGGLETAMVQ